MFYINEYMSINEKATKPSWTLSDSLDSLILSKISVSNRHLHYEAQNRDEQVIYKIARSKTGINEIDSRR